MASFGRRQDGRRYESSGSDVTLSVRCQRSGAEVEMQLLELSPGGLKLRGAVPPGALAKRDAVEATVTWEGRPLTLTGEVAWISGEGEGEIEGGIRFDSLSLEQRDRLAALVALMQIGEGD